jgi:hypothetical protein
MTRSTRWSRGVVGTLAVVSAISSSAARRVWAQDVKAAAKEEAAIEDAARRGLGRCPDKPAADSVTLASVVAKPDKKPRRMPGNMQITAGQGAFRLEMPEDQFHNMEGHPRRVGVTAVIDTSGRVVPGTVTITSSSSGELSMAVCHAFADQRFRPGQQAGATVLAQYNEILEFIGTAATSTLRSAKDESSVR